MARKNLGKRPMSPRQQENLQEMLRVAEQEANTFNVTRDSTAVYGSQVFSAEEEINLLKKNNVIDEGWVNKSMEDLKMPKSPEQMEHDALEAAGFANKAAKMEDASTEEEPTQKTEEEKEEQKPLTEEEKYALVFAQLEARFPGKPIPSIEKMKQWKQMYGDIFVLPFDGKLFFIYRYLNQQEWTQINADPTWANLTPVQQDRKMVEKCLLFPQYAPEEKGLLPANCFGLLSQQIQLQSMFLPPAAVAEMTMKI